MPRQVRFETNQGDFVVEVSDSTPITSGNFISLVQDGFYDGLSFHRVIDNFCCQFGCPHSKNPGSNSAGSGGPTPNSTFTSLDGKQMSRNSSGCIPDEFVTQDSNLPGTLSMANTGRPNSGGSQFFINTVHNKYLDWFDKSTPSKHPVFGKIVAGFDVIGKISKCPKGSGDKPNPPVIVTKASVIQ